jgi:hypothetical protein
MNQLVAIEPQKNVDLFRASTDAASICKDIVVATATNIQGRKYVCVEGWQAIAIAHGCTASACAVERVDGGVRAVGQIRRMSDGAVIAEAEGFVGEDEPTWFGGPSRGKTLPKRADYAIRAMAQTRAISRACRSAFAHVVVMMNAGLSTTPAEEVPDGGFDDTREAPASQTRTKAEAKATPTKINEAQWNRLTMLLETTRSDVAKFCEVYRCKSVRELAPAAYDRAVSKLEEKLAKMKPAQSENIQDGEFSEITEADLTH